MKLQTEQYQVDSSEKERSWKEREDNLLQKHKEELANLHNASIDKETALREGYEMKLKPLQDEINLRKDELA